MDYRVLVLNGRMLIMVAQTRDGCLHGERCD